MTENNIKVFEYPDFGIIRTIEEDGKVLFCASDVAKALGYAKPNNAVSAHCRYPVKRGAPHPQNPNKQIKMLFISEGDVYGLIIHSRLPSAPQFENWVCNEILPSIHSRGVYAVEELLNDPDFAIKTFKALKEERERVKAL